MSRRIGILHGGASYHLRTLQDKRVATIVDRALYLPELAPGTLDSLDVLVVCDRVHPGLLARHADDVLGVARRCGTVAVLGEVHAERWVPGLRFDPRPTNFWWWRTGEDPGIRTRAPGHAIWKHLTTSDVTWHFHGLLHPPPDATALVTFEQDGRETGTLLYEDAATLAGRLLVTTMDPTYHHGSNFMPAASGFLLGLLASLADDADQPLARAPADARPPS